MTIPVQNYGLHTTPKGIVYLLQGRTANNFIGAQEKSPFELTGTKRACPHLISTNAPVPDRYHWTLFLRLAKDALMQELMPIPKEYGSFIPYLADPQNELLLTMVALSRMSSPIYPVVHPIGRFSLKEIIFQLSLTNIAPLVLTGVQPKDQEYMYQVASEACKLPRRLLFTGCSKVTIRQLRKR